MLLIGKDITALLLFNNIHGSRAGDMRFASSRCYKELFKGST